MLLATSDMIKKIDRYAADMLGIPISELIDRSGEAVARVVRARVKKGARIIVLAGKGNNGADGYMTAAKLLCDYDVIVYDIFGEGASSEGARAAADIYKGMNGRVIISDESQNISDELSSADCLIDAVFGTGFYGEIPSKIRELSSVIDKIQGVDKIAIDLPIGVSSDDGSVDCTGVYNASATVALSFAKPAHFSYPAKKHIGKLYYDNIGLHKADILRNFDFKYRVLDADESRSLVSHREDNSNKGTFGKLLLITGSQEYLGAGVLTLEAALRGGVGYVTHLGEKEQNEILLQRFPETVFKCRSTAFNMDEDEVKLIVSLSEKHTVTLIGSGCGNTEGLYRLVTALISCSGGPIVLDADAINVLAMHREESISLISNSPRDIVITPHPLEFSRLIGIDVDQVQNNRISLARKFAEECKCVVVLKGAATIVTDGLMTYINSSGSSALAKAGSGDVLAGYLASCIASSGNVLASSALSVYIHGVAGDNLAAKLSESGVTPSDLPVEMAKAMCEIAGKNL